MTGPRAGANLGEKVVDMASRATRCVSNLTPRWLYCSSRTKVVKLGRRAYMAQPPKNRHYRTGGSRGLSSCVLRGTLGGFDHEEPNR